MRTGRGVDGSATKNGGVAAPKDDRPPFWNDGGRTRCRAAPTQCETASKELTYDARLFSCMVSSLAPSNQSGFSPFSGWENESYLLVLKKIYVIDFSLLLVWMELANQSLSPTQKKELLFSMDP